jgi:hypothetical protein
MRGVKALLKAIGIDSTPDVDDDINYIPHYDSLPVASGEGSLIALDDGQKSAKPTAVKAKDDPSPIDAPHDERMLAYERDARSMRRR